MDFRLLRALSREFLDSLEVLALALGGEDAFVDRLGDLWVFVQVVVEVGLEEIPDEGPQRLAARLDGLVDGLDAAGYKVERVELNK